MSRPEHAWLPRIKLSDPVVGSGRIIVSADNLPFIRISDDVARVLSLAQGSFPNVDVGSIASALGTSSELVEATLRTVGASPALVHQLPRANKRLQFRAPFSVQLTLFNPSALLARVPFIVGAVRNRWWWRSQVAVSVVGVVLLLLVAITPDSPLHRPMTGAQYVVVFAALFLTAFIHEFAHALALTAFGGQSHRLGVMLFYLAPACFCDVSDAWRLPPERRVRVALAGVLAQTAVAAVAAFVALLVTPSVAVAFDVFAVLCLAYGLVNLVPLVKLDGYIALVGHLDRPNLRATAVQAFRSSMARALLGERTGLSAERLPRGGRVPIELILFGFGCAVFPVVLVAGAGLAVNTYLASWGAFGAWITLGVFALIALIGIVLFGRGAARIVRRANSIVRGLIVVTAAGAVVVATIVALPLPQQVTGGVLDTAQGPVLAIAGATSTIPTGSRVTLYRSAVFPSRQVGTAIVTGSETSCLVPLDAIAPMTGTGLQAKARCFPVATSADLSPATVAVIASDGVPLARQIHFLVNRILTK